MKYLYRFYQLFIVLPIAFVLTILTSVVTSVGCALGGALFWGYWPPRLWSWCVVRLFLLPVHVSGRGNIDAGSSYVFVANHQGAFDIFLIYGFLRRNMRWMMKYQLLRIPFVGFACKRSRQIIVDRRGPGRIRRSYDQARLTLSHGVSVCVFPEGSRTVSGRMGLFHRGAFMLAAELGLPVVPLTINGSFDALPRSRDWRWITWSPLSLTIHKPIEPRGVGEEEQKAVMSEAWDAVESALAPEYRGTLDRYKDIDR